jgi:hypothetical protein
MNYYENAVEPSVNDNIANGVNVENNRHQFMMTVGYRF